MSLPTTHKKGLVYVGRGVRVAYDENKLLLDSEVSIATLGWPCTQPCMCVWPCAICRRRRHLCLATAHVH